MAVALRAWDLVIDVVWLTAARVGGRNRPGRIEAGGASDGAELAPGRAGP